MRHSLGCHRYVYKGVQLAGRLAEEWSEMIHLCLGRATLCVACVRDAPLEIASKFVGAIHEYV